MRPRRRMSNEIRVYIGCSPNCEDLESQAVVEYSLQRYASSPVSITWMKLSRDPTSPFYSNVKTGEGWRTGRWATPFSAFRWAVPALAGFTGKAIYSDSDFIYRADIAELHKQEFRDGAVVMIRQGAGMRFCCSMWNCEAARAVLPPLDQLQRDENSHALMTQLFQRNPKLIQFYDGKWNEMDTQIRDVNSPDIKAVHYTHMPTQPHLKYALPRLKAEGRQHWMRGNLRTPHPNAELQHLFDTVLADAHAAGYTLDKYRGDPAFGPFK